MSFHVVICRAGETQEHVDGRGMHDATREAIIADLISGEYHKPLRVLELHESAETPRHLPGLCLDVSSEIAASILHRAGMRGDLPEFWDRRRDLLNFCQEHAGMVACNETMGAHGMIGRYLGYEEKDGDGDRVALNKRSEWSP